MRTEEERRYRDENKRRGGIEMRTEEERRYRDENSREMNSGEEV